MDYTYPEEERLKLDCKTEKAICEIKDNLSKVMRTLDDLHRKVEAIENRQSS